MVVVVLGLLAVEAVVAVVLGLQAAVEEEGEVVVVHHHRGAVVVVEGWTFVVGWCGKERADERDRRVCRVTVCILQHVT